MDNSADSSPQDWSTPLSAAVALLGAGVALLVCAVVVSTDPAGRTIMAIAGLMLVGYGTYAAKIRPRLSLTTDPSPTLTVRRIGGELVLDPASVERIRLLSMRRIGRRSGQLEIDYHPAEPAADTRLVVFGRWDLGADLRSVLDDLDRAGFPVQHPDA